MENEKINKNIGLNHYKAKDLTGKSYGSFKVVQMVNRVGKGNFCKLICQECGFEKIMTVGKLTDTKRVYQGNCFACYRALNGKENKKCRKCNKLLHISNFRFSKTTSDSLSRWCNNCIEDNLKKTLPHRQKHSFKKRRSDPDHVYYRIKKNAESRKLEFSISMDDFMLHWNKPCFYCGDITINGLDRINNSTGYTKNNLISCCPKCNVMKMKLDYDDFICHVFKIQKNINDKLKINGKQ